MSDKSKYYDKLEYYWIHLLWNETRMRNAVAKGWITAEEFTEITGIEY